VNLRRLPTVPSATIDLVARLHGAVDDLAGNVARRNEGRLACRRGCASCCADDLTVFEAEAQLIAERYPDLVEEGSPHPPGGCAFLSADGGCRIYENRPYVCRTQGLPLRWLEEDGDLAYEARDICEKNLPGEPLEALPVEACWTLGPVEARLAAAQRSIDGGEGRRVALRSLFWRS
jgi:uncharacterized protein